ncbi:MAG: PRD domain-containing protein [Tissierellia bacterium]|nr:PRD domain-containing protein [Tissierellia bacterium]
MIWKELENRILFLLKNLQSSSFSEDALLKKLDVSKKTLISDIKNLNKYLEKCAYIDVRNKIVSLYIYDYKIYKKQLAMLQEEEKNFNNEKYRLVFIIRYLFENKTVTIGDLSYKMLISNTTLSKDIAKLNSMISSYHVKIVGKTNVGIRLSGDELSIRNLLIDECYSQISLESKDYRLISQIVDDILSSYVMDEHTVRNLKIYLYVALLRIYNSNNLEELSDKIDGDNSNLIEKIKTNIKNKVYEFFDVELSATELSFISIPLVGMRTPIINSKNLEIKIGVDIYNLVEEIFTTIKTKMDLDVDLGQLTSNFNYHIYFLLSRIRMGYEIDNSLNEEIKRDYRVAYKMAEISASVIENRLNQKVSESEKSYLASYFQVYVIEKLELITNNLFKIAILTSDRINSHMIKKKLKDSYIDGELSISVLENSNIDMSQFDLLITDLEVDNDVDMISGSDIYKFSLIEQRIDEAIERKYKRFNDRFLKSVFLNELSENKVFILEDDDYFSNISRMIDDLVKEDDIDKNFKDRIFQRERLASTIFSENIAFPHAKSDKLIVALGINKKSLPTLIFLVGVPENMDEVLVKLYDEIVSITSDEKIVEGISQVSTYSELMEFFIKDTDLFR